MTLLLAAGAHAAPGPPPPAWVPDGVATGGVHVLGGGGWEAWPAGGAAAVWARGGAAGETAFGAGKLGGAWSSAVEGVDGVWGQRHVLDSTWSAGSWGIGVLGTVGASPAWGDVATGVRLAGATAQLRAGPAVHAGADAAVPGAGIQAGWHRLLGPRWSVVAWADGRAWLAAETARWSAELIASGRWAPVPALALELTAIGRAAEERGTLDGLPASPTALGVTGLEWDVRRGVFARVEGGARQDLAGTGPAAWALVGVGWRATRVGGRVPAPPAAGPHRFRLVAPEAGSAEVVGSFAGWVPLPMRATPDGWVLDVTLAPGEYEYSYLVDGVVLLPPDAHRSRPDGFGGENAVIVIAEPVTAAAPAP